MKQEKKPKWKILEVISCDNDRIKAKVKVGKNTWPVLYSIWHGLWNINGTAEAAEFLPNSIIDDIELELERILEYIN